VEAEVEVEEVMVVVEEVAEAEVMEDTVMEDMDMEEEGVVGDIMVEVLDQPAMR
jgi:hypothetical protein